MPILGAETKAGTVRAWIRSEGDPVRAGEIIAVISTPKLDMELESPATGTLRTILIDEEEMAAVGAALAIIDPEETTDAAD